MEKCSYCIVGALRRRYFPIGEITGRLIAAPTRSVPPHCRGINFAAFVGVVLRADCATEWPHWVILGNFGNNKNPCIFRRRGFCLRGNYEEITKDLSFPENTYLLFFSHSVAQWA